MRLLPTPKTTLARHPERGSFERALVHSVLDEGLVCHVAIADSDGPVAIPMAYARIDDTLYLHGSRASRLLRAVAAGAPLCLAVTLLDGLVLARSAMHHSMNYRSVVLFAVTRVVEDEREKRAALTALVNHAVPGRAAEVRAPTREELGATLVLAVPIAEASAKVRSGPPLDLAEDHALSCWAGVLPLSLQAGAPEADPELRAAIPVPQAVHRYARPRRRPSAPKPTSTSTAAMKPSAADRPGES